MRIGISVEDSSRHITHLHGAIGGVIGLAQVEIVFAIGHDSVRGHEIFQGVFFAGFLGFFFLPFYFGFTTIAHILGEVLQIEEVEAL